MCRPQPLAPQASRHVSRGPHDDAALEGFGHDDDPADVEAEQRASACLERREQPVHRQDAVREVELGQAGPWPPEGQHKRWVLGRESIT